MADATSPNLVFGPPAVIIVVDGQYRLEPGAHVNILHGKAATEADMQSAVQQAIP